MKTAHWLAIFAMGIGGCTRNEYELTLSPAGNSLERALKVKHVTSQGSYDPAAFDEEMRQIAEGYHADAPDSATAHVFRGSFAGRMPKDVGGYGTFTRWDTSLGSAAAYVERFRGDDDVAGELDRRRAASDRLVDLLVAWLEREIFGMHPLWATPLTIFRSPLEVPCRRVFVWRLPF